MNRLYSVAGPLALLMTSATLPAQPVSLQAPAAPTRAQAALDGSKVRFLDVGRVFVQSNDYGRVLAAKLQALKQSGVSRAEAERSTEPLRKQLNDAFVDRMTKLLGRFASERDIEVVIARPDESVVWMKNGMADLLKSLDITNEVVELINRR